MTRDDSQSAYVTVLSAVVDLLGREGAPPPAQNISQQTGLHTDYVRRVLRQLTEDGALTQPYGERGPYVPLRRPDGTPVRVLLVDAEGQPHTTPPPADPIPEGLTVREAAERLQITERTVHRWIRSGRLKAEKVGLEWRIDRESAEMQPDQEPPTDQATTLDTLHALIDALPEEKQAEVERFVRFVLGERG